MLSCRRERYFSLKIIKNRLWVPWGSFGVVRGSKSSLGGARGCPGGPCGGLGRVLGVIFGALATLKIELSPARELNFHVFTVLPFKTAF